MYIHEAVKAALEAGKCIRREDMTKGVLIKPTESDFYCCVLVIQPTKKRAPRWNPSAKELTSDRWVVAENPDIDLKLKPIEDMTAEEFLELLDEEGYRDH